VWAVLWASGLAAAGDRAVAQAINPGDLDGSAMERRVIDESEHVAGWSNGSPEETTISADTTHVRQNPFSLAFANAVDHTKGEKNYPIGWPRTGRDFAKLGLTDWSKYEFFECWIFAVTSRESLPKTPLNIGFYHSGAKRSSSFPLPDVRKDAWTRVVIPVSRIAEPRDVQRVQFNISESEYRHGDRVTFFISDLALTRFAHPVIADLAMERQLVYSHDRQVTARYTLMGQRAAAGLAVELEIGCGDKCLVRTAEPPGPASEISLAVEPPLAPGHWWAKLNLRDHEGKLLHHKQAAFQVIPGPFGDEE